MITVLAFYNALIVYRISRKRLSSRITPAWGSIGELKSTLSRTVFPEISTSDNPLIFEYVPMDFPGYCLHQKDHSSYEAGSTLIPVIIRFNQIDCSPIFFMTNYLSSVFNNHFHTGIICMTPSGTRTVPSWFRVISIPHSRPYCSIASCKPVYSCSLFRSVIS